MVKIMKTQNEKNKNLVKGKIFGLLIAVFATLVVGCGKDKAKNNNDYNGFGSRFGYGGVGYNGYGQVSNVMAGVDNSGQFMVILATSSNQSMGYGGGPGFVEGELRLFAPIACLSMSMGLNPGLYQLIPPTNSPNAYDVSMLQNVQLLARGPGGEALITVPYAVAFQTNVCGFNGMQGSIMIQSVNGVPCGRQLFFTDQMYDPGMCR